MTPKRTYIRDILQKGEAEQSLTVCGWIRTARGSKHLAFISINDGSDQDSLQLIVPAESAHYELSKGLQTGDAVQASGKLVASPAKGQSWELHTDSLELLGQPAGGNYPLQKKGHSLEFLRDISHLRPRTNTFGAVFRVRNQICQATHDFFQKRGFVWAQTPILTAADAEGAGELFAVSSHGQGEKKEFFGKQAYLTVSGQLQAEFLALSLGDVYTFGPTFRAENSNTPRHLAEFWMIEPEMAFYDLEDNMTLAEEYVKHLIATTLEKCEKELQFFQKLYKTIQVEDLKKLVTAKFHRVSYTQAIEDLKKASKKFEFPVQWGLDLQTEHERYLTEEVYGGPTFVYDYPKDIKAFYMRMNDDGKTVAAMDLLLPRVGELIGGSQREERLDRLEARMGEMQIPFQDLQWYLDLRRFGSVKHSGFGLGLERMVMFVTGMQNIRDVIMCPRSPNSIDF